MEPTTSLLSLSSRSSSRASLHSNHDPLLPSSEKQAPKPTTRFNSLLGRRLYQLIVIWTVASLVVASILLLRSKENALPGVGGSHFTKSQPPAVVASPDGSGEDKSGIASSVEVETGKQPAEKQQADKLQADKQQADEQKADKQKAKDAQAAQPSTQDKQESEPYDEQKDLAELDAQADAEAAEEAGAQETAKYEEELKKTPWLRFKHLDGYFHGLKTLVSKPQHEPEYPNKMHEAPFPQPPLRQDLPKQRPYDPYNASKKDVRTCYLDKANMIPAPDMFAYDGVPQHMPDPAIGSYDVLGLRDDVCFDRFGRYGPYGLGYTRVQGGMGIGLDTERSGNDEVWAKSGQINYNAMDWNEAQDRCLEANTHRFLVPDPETEELPEPLDGDEGKKARTAVVVRLYTGFRWTELAMLNFRAMITELSLKSGGEYTVHFLLHIRDGDQPIWSDDETVQQILDANVPPEFHGLVTLWSEPQMKLFYPGKFEKPIQNPSNSDVHGVYRSAHFPMQIFAMQHPEYQHFWNWEMDMRYVGNYYELLDRMGSWADAQPRQQLWERDARYYIPSYHGSWENFTATVQQNTDGNKGIFGPINFLDKKPLRQQQRGGSILPLSCAVGQDAAKCGVGEPADLITLNPIFDVEGSGWYFSNDATGYTGNPPRRCAIVTASRLSRRLLSAMHEEVWRHHHTMFAEMFPPSVALHHGLKATYAPHPVFLDRAWSPPSSIDAAFNGGRDHSTSGHGSPYDLRNEHNHKGTTWYYNSQFAGLLWRRWLGYAQMDGRGRSKGGSGVETERGGMEEEVREESSGRMCLRSMLLHPIKQEHPVE